MKDRTVKTGTGNAGKFSDEDGSIDIFELLLKLWAGKWQVAAFAALGVFLGIFVFVTTPKTYQADALVQLESKGNKMGLPAALLGLPDAASDTTTEIEIIRSRLVLGQAVAALHLDWLAEPVLMPVIGVALQRYDLPLPGLPAYARRDTAIALDLLQVDKDWVQKPIQLTITAENSFDVTLPDGEALSGKVGVTLNNAAKTFALRVASLSGGIGRQFKIEQRDEFDTIEGLRKNLNVAEKARGSGILLLQFKAGTPSQAEKILNAVTDAYANQNIARGVANAESGLKFLDSQLPPAEKAVRDAEKELNDYRRKANVVDLSFESQAMLTQIEKINTDLQTLRLQEGEIQRRYTPNHPVYQQLLANRARLEQQLAQLQVESTSLPETQRNVLNLTHVLEMAQDTYTQLQTQSQSTKVLRASNIGSVRIIDMAQATAKPIAPRGSSILALSVFLGALLGVVFVLLRNWLHRGVQGADQIEALGLSVFATINYVPEADTKQKNHLESQPILAMSDPGNIAVEAFRSLRTSLHFGMLDAPTKSIVLTSAAPGVGKSFTAVNLATVVAQGGQRVCLIDADMRRGRLRKFFNQPKNSAGLAEYLAEQSSLEQVLLQGPIEGFSFIGSGRFPPNPADLLLRSRMAELLALLNDKYDMIIIDSPPVLAVTDPVVLGGISGAILMVARHDITQLSEVDATKKVIEGAGLKVAGAILNGYDPNKTAGNSYSYRYDYRPTAD